MKRPSRPEITGPLAPYAAGFWEELSRLGYSRWAALRHLYVTAHLSRWLGEHELGPAEFTSARVGQFLADRQVAGYVRRLTPRGIPLLGYLRDVGVLPEEATPCPEGSVERLLEEFVEYLKSERGLALATVVGYRRIAERFLVKCAPDARVEGCGVERLGAEQIDVFLLSEGARRSIGTVNNMVTALRALMRFFYIHGYTATPLADCVPHGAAWRNRAGPPALTASEMRRILASCDRRTAAGRRDFAILTVLARLGLRAGETASLSLDDLDWEAGEIAVCGKGGRRDRLPLPVDVGRAIADYCQRGRPRNGHRALFLQVRAPYGPLSRDAISRVVKQACRRAGLAPVGAHRLRHASASAMRRAGAPLLEIGQVLRHRWTVNTALYAKDDLSALAGIARPWPGGRA